VAIDATVAGANADSYLTVAEADAFAAVRLGRFAARWLDAGTTTDNKEDALKQATSDVDAFVRVGPRFSTTQALIFPREIDELNDVPFLPKRVKEATYEQAAYVLATANLQDDAADRRARGLFSFSEDNLGGTVAVDPNFGRLAPRAEQLLRSVFTTRAAYSGSVPVKSAVLASWEAEQ
jgi:hypothetical protein